jgi:hypothetical protein
MTVIYIPALFVDITKRLTPGRNIANTVANPQRIGRVTTKAQRSVLQDCTKEIIIIK